MWITCWLCSARSHDVWRYPTMVPSASRMTACRHTAKLGIVLYSTRASSSGLGGSSGWDSACRRFRNALTSSIASSGKDGISSSSTSIEVLRQLVCCRLPRRRADVRLESQRLIDAEHRVVRVGVPGPDLADVRAFGHQTLNVHGLQPLPEGAAAMFGTDSRSALMSDRRQGLRVVEQFRESDELPRRIVPRGDEPALG